MFSSLRRMHSFLEYGSDCHASSYDGHLGSVNGISMTEAPAASVWHFLFSDPLPNGVLIYLHPTNPSSSYQDDGALLCCTASGDGSAHLWIAAAKQIRYDALLNAYLARGDHKLSACCSLHLPFALSDLESVAEVNVEADFGDGMDNLEPGPTCIIDTPRRVLMGHASAVSATELLLHGTQVCMAKEKTLMVVPRQLQHLFPPSRCSTFS